jgi:hypothetical protein
MIAHGQNGPTIHPLDLNHVLGTAEAAFSVDVRSADQISPDDRVLSVGSKVPIPSRRSVDAAHIPCFKLEMLTAPIAYTAAGTVLRFISRPAHVLKMPGQNRAMCPIKEKESESY